MDTPFSDLLHSGNGVVIEYGSVLRLIRYKGGEIGNVQLFPSGCYRSEDLICNQPGRGTKKIEAPCRLWLKLVMRPQAPGVMRLNRTSMSTCCSWCAKYMWSRAMTIPVSSAGFHLGLNFNKKEPHQYSNVSPKADGGWGSRRSPVCDLVLVEPERHRLQIWGHAKIGNGVEVGAMLPLIK